ncbi:MAG: C-type lectin domain-containing protein [Deltaproteobacteria bacterium]
MRVRISPRKSETSYSRRARTARSIAALCLGGAGCADVLDIPEHPRVAKDTASSSGVERTEQAAVPEIESGSGSEDITVRALEGSSASPQLNESGPSALSAPSAATLEAESADAGPPVVRLAPADASSPPRSDASPPALCAASGVVGPNGRCYARLGTLRTWADSRQRCRSLGAGWDLASIRSDEVNRFLTELLTGETWIGASDANAEGTWIWVDDGTAFWRGDDTGNPVNAAYASWDRTQPNGRAIADCARLVPEASGAWGDLSCAQLRNAVCAGPRD